MLAATFSGASDEFCAARAFIGVWGSGHAFCTRQLGARRADSGVVKKCINSGGESGINRIGVCRHFLHAPTGGERGRFGVWYAEWCPRPSGESTPSCSRDGCGLVRHARAVRVNAHTRDTLVHTHSHSHTLRLSLCSSPHVILGARAQTTKPLPPRSAHPHATPLVLAAFAFT